jgi:hypothetical protein
VGRSGVQLRFLEFQTGIVRHRRKIKENENGIQWK